MIAKQAACPVCRRTITVVSGCAEQEGFTPDGFMDPDRNGVWGCKCEFTTAIIARGEALKLAVDLDALETLIDVLRGDDDEDEDGEEASA